MSSYTRGIVVTVAVLVILFPFVFSLISSLLTGNSEIDGVFLERPDPKYQECVSGDGVHEVPSYGSLERDQRGIRPLRQPG